MPGMHFFVTSRGRSLSDLGFYGPFLCLEIKQSKMRDLDQEFEHEFFLTSHLGRLVWMNLAKMAEALCLITFSIRSPSHKSRREPISQIESSGGVTVSSLPMPGIRI